MILAKEHMGSKFWRYGWEPMSYFIPELIIGNVVGGSIFTNFICRETAWLPIDGWEVWNPLKNKMQIRNMRVIQGGKKESLSA